MQSNNSSLNNKLISQWQEEEISLFVKSIGLSNYFHNFQNNNINGYDLCFLSNEDIINELRITKIHDKNTLLKAIREAILDQLSLTLNYDERSINLQLDFDRNLNLDTLLQFFRDIFRLSENRVYVLNSNQELLSPNCKIVDLILINPGKYKTLTITNDLRKIFNDVNKVNKSSDYNYKSNDNLNNDNFNDQKSFANKSQLFSENNNYELVNNEYNNYRDSHLSGYKSSSKLNRNYKVKEDNLKSYGNENSFSQLKPNSVSYIRNYEIASKPQENNLIEEQLFKESPQINEIENNQEIVSSIKKGEIIERTNNYFNNLKNLESSSLTSNKNNINLYNEGSQEVFSGGVNIPESNFEDKSRYNYKFASSEKRFYRNLVDKDNLNQQEDLKKEFNNTSSISKYSLMKNDDIYNKGNDLKSKIDSMRNEINNTLKGDFHRNKEVLDENNLDNVPNKTRENKSAIVRNNSSYYSTKLYK